MVKLLFYYHLLESIKLRNASRNKSVSQLQTACPDFSNVIFCLTGELIF